MVEAPSGKQLVIAAGPHEAVIVEVGGGIRSYTVDGRPLLEGYQASEMCTGARGLPLVPWPNRIEDGAYTFDGNHYQLALTEPDKRNAIHGLLQSRNWTILRHDDDRVLVGTRLHPGQGYPFSLDVRVEYALNDVGLVVHTSATNVGDLPCPYGTGHHPYLAVGGDAVDGCRLQVDAERWIPTDDRGLPTGARPVVGSPYDFRRERLIGGLEIDNAFTGLARDSDGLAWVRLTASTGDAAELWLDSGYPLVQIYTAHSQPEPHYRRGLAVEPMTCAPNAFRSGDGLIRLGPGETATARWGMQPA